MNRAFTLIELLVVISVIALLSSVVLASLANARDKARVAKALAAERDMHNQILIEDVNALVGQWSFDEGVGTDVFDTSGNGYHGSFSGAVSWGEGVSNSALEFEGGEDFVLIDTYTHDDTPEDRTLSAWIKYEGANTAGELQGIIDVMGIGGNNNQTSLQMSAGGAFRAHVIMEDAFGNVVGGTASSSALPIGVWKFVAATFVYDEGAETYEITIYVDGSEVASQTVTDPDGVVAYQFASDRIHVGGQKAGFGRVFNGSIDTVRFYNRAFTPSEVARVYEDSKERYVPRFAKQ